MVFERRHRDALTCSHSTPTICAGEFTRLSVRSQEHNRAANTNLSCLLPLAQIISVVFKFIELNQFLPELSAAVNLVRETKFPVDTTRTCGCKLQLSPCTCANNFNVTSFWGVDKPRFRLIFGPNFPFFLHNLLSNPGKKRVNMLSLAHFCAHKWYFSISRYPAHK